MTIAKIYSKDSFEMANVLVSVDKWTKHQEVDIPQARETLKVIADTIDMVYVNGFALELKKNEIAEIVQDTFKGMDKRTVSKMRVYSNEYDAIIVYLDKIGSYSVSVDRMVQTYQSHTNKVKKELEGGIDAWRRKTYAIPTPKKDLEVGEEKIKTGYESVTKPVTMDDHFMVMGRFLFTVNEYVKNNSYTVEQETKIIESFSEIVAKLAEKHTLKKVA